MSGWLLPFPSWLSVLSVLTEGSLSVAKVALLLRDKTIQCTGKATVEGVSAIPCEMVDVSSWFLSSASCRRCNNSNNNKIVIINIIIR